MASPPKTLTDEERNAVCTRYAQTGSLRTTAGEFGISPMRVKRLWEGLDETGRERFREAVARLRQQTEIRIVRSEVADDYFDRLVAARNAAVGELCRRLSDDEQRRAFSDKNLVAAVKILHELSVGEHTPKEPDNLFLTLNQQLHNEINHFYIRHDGTTRETDDSPAGTEPDGTRPDR